MTQGYPPPARGSNAGADQDTATLPKVGTSQQPPSQQSGGWSSPPVNSGPGSGSGPDDGSSGNGFGAKLASKASAAAATATSAASSAKGAMKTAASEAETRAARGRSGRGVRQPRRARLTLSHINVYSVFKFSCVLAIALFFVWLIMVGVLYGILDVAGVFSKVNETVQTISGDEKSGDVVTGSLVFGAAIIIGAVNIVLFIALSTIGAMIYNLCADLVGGAEVTLSERE
ncbi:MAG TPA: DUF3566 domain-containing protein [Jatrophihabitans sp.]|jgi:hypothetical protein|uniref:DUF3566 domain-containing protein n=1 Tax=Jatrophihabitans sp. TaxID=1932789 RepID=UPI002F08D337